MAKHTHENTTIKERIHQAGGLGRDGTGFPDDHPVDCVESWEQPVDNLPSAARSDILSHLIDMSARTGRKLAWDPLNETITGEPQAEAMMHREMRQPSAL